jgi:hypothetical protein
VKLDLSLLTWPSRSEIAALFAEAQRLGAR